MTVQLQAIGLPDGVVEEIDTTPGAVAVTPSGERFTRWPTGWVDDDGADLQAGLIAIDVERFELP